MGGGYKLMMTPTDKLKAALQQAKRISEPTFVETEHHKLIVEALALLDTHVLTLRDPTEGWLLIDSAPRDRTYIIGYMSSIDRSYSVMLDLNGDTHIAGLSGHKIYGITHWQPLPPPPKGEIDAI